jgi:riboflavin kinase / FMN adenylyltransferase
MVVAATGFFDGVHTGHRKVLEQLCTLARSENKRSAVITFWPHPRSVLQQDAYALRLLTTLEEKKAIIKGIGVNKVIVIPFTKEFSTLSTADFLKEYLVDKYEVSDLIIGYDHRLGHDTNLGQDEMVRIADKAGIKTVRVEEYLIGGKVISSTKIRNLLGEGYIKEANDYLGYNYSISGVVVAGEQIGRKLGFPTANMQLYNPLKVVPGRGVYAVQVQVLDKIYTGICNIGIRPTVSKDNKISIETHILDFDEDIYGLDMTVSFLYKIREEQKFPSRADLVEQLERDKEFAINYSGHYLKGLYRAM